MRTNFGLELDFLIRPLQGWAPERNARRVRKMGARTQRKASSQDGRPNATQGEFATWAPESAKSRNETHQEPGQGWATKGKARRVGKRGTQTQCKASWQDGSPKAQRSVTKRTNNRNKTHEEL
jgi:hypothetical protein